MTARKFVVSKRGVKREARSPKASARERLLAFVCAPAFVGYNEKAWDAKTRRLLRAHERELAERAQQEAAKQMERAYNAGMRGDVFWYEGPRDKVRAAILGTAGPRKRGER